MSSYIETSTRYHFVFSLAIALKSLEKSAYSLLNWLWENHMKGDAKKYHFLVIF